MEGSGIFDTKGIIWYRGILILVFFSAVVQKKVILPILDYLSLKS